MAYVLKLQALSAPEATRHPCYSHVTSYAGTCAAES
jgi:hypothetical protein